MRDCRRIRTSWLGPAHGVTSGFVFAFSCSAVASTA